MWVDPSARRRGIGRRLVDAVLRWARDRHQPAVWLWVASHNTAAKRLYEEAGFSDSGLVEGHAVEMRLDLFSRPAA